MFGEKAGEAVLTELEVLRKEDSRNAFESTMKATEKRADETGHRKIKGA